jgi:hypothetical protein
MNCIGGTRRVLVSVIVLISVLSFLIWWPPALVGEHLSFVITELTTRTTRNTTLPVCAFRNQRLQEEAARVKRTTQSAHAPVSRPSVPCVRDFG